MLSIYLYLILALKPLKPYLSRVFVKKGSLPLITTQLHKTKLMKNRNLILSFLGLASLFSACDTSYFDENEVKSPTINIPVKGLPIGHITYTTKSLLQELDEKLEIGESEDGLVAFTYTDTLDSSDNDELIEFESQIIDDEISFKTTNTTTNYSGPNISLNKEFKKTNTVKNEETLTKASFSKGTFEIKINSNYSSKANIDFTFNSLKRISDNTPFEFEFILNNDMGEDIKSTNTQDLSGYYLDLDLDADGIENTDITNIISTNYKVLLSVKNGDTFNSENKINYEIIFNNILIKTAEGDFKQQNFKIDSSSFDLDFFDNLGDGGIIELEDPIFKINATNSYGFSVGVVLDNITTDATQNNQLEITDTSDINKNIFDNNDLKTGHYAIVEKGGVTATTTTVTLDNTNSNLVTLLKEKPKKFILDINAVSNPNSPVGNKNTFDSLDSLDIDIEVLIPLHVKFDNVTFNEEFDINEIEELSDRASSITLSVVTTNSIPLAGKIEMKFLDSNGNNLGINQNIVGFDAAPVDNEGFSMLPATPTGNREVFTFKGDDIKKLEQTDKIVSVLTFDTTDANNDTNPDAVKIRATDTVKFQLGLSGDLSIDLEEDDDQ